LKVNSGFVVDILKNYCQENFFKIFSTEKTLILEDSSTEKEH